MKKFEIKTDKRTEYFHGSDDGLELFLRDYFDKDEKVDVKYVGEVDQSQ